MAPEIISEGTYTTKVDVFSFGILFWVLHKHEQPHSRFNGPTSALLKAVANHIAPLRPELSADWPARHANVMALCWHPYPDERPSFDQIVRLISGNVEGQPDGENV